MFTELDHGSAHLLLVTRSRRDGKISIIVRARGTRFESIGHSRYSKEETVCSVNKLKVSVVFLTCGSMTEAFGYSERLSQDLLSSSLPFPPFFLSLEVESAKPSRRNLRYPIDFPAGMLLHRGSRGILPFN